MSYRSASEIKDVISSLIYELGVQLVSGRSNVDHILDRMRTDSIDFCFSLESGDLSLGNSIGEGGNGYVGPLLEGAKGRVKREIMVNERSRSDNGKGWITDYSRVVIKKNKGDPSLLNLRYDRSTKTIYSSDPIHESLVQGLITEFVEAGITPHITEIYGSYICDSGSYSLIQRADFSLLDPVISNDRDKIAEMFTFQNLAIWTFQIAWTFYCLKGKYGIVHEDMHAGNVLFIDLADPKNDTVMYGSKYLKDVDHLIYDYNGAVLAVPKGRYLLKVADFGYTECSIPIGGAGDHVTLSNSTENKIYKYDSLKNILPKIGNNLESSYFIRIVSVLMKRMIDLSGFTFLEPVLRDYTTFASSLDRTFNYQELLHQVYPTMVEFERQRTHPEGPLQTLRGNGRYHIQFRGWGEEGLPNGAHVQRMMVFFNTHRLFSTQNLSPGYPVPENAVVSRQRDSFELSNARLQYNVYSYGQCVLEGGKDCDDILTRVEVDYYGDYYQDSFDFTSIKEDSSLLTSNGNLRTNLTFEDLSRHVTEEVGGCRHAELVIQPSVLGERMRSSLSYFPYQTNLVRSSPVRSGQVMEQITLHVVMPTSNRSFSVSSGKKRNLISSLKKEGLSSAFNGGYFIVQGNVSNPLTGYLKSKTMGNEYISLPIGFFCSEGKGSTIVPVPLPYERDFAVVLERRGKVEIVPYEEFLLRHQLTRGDALILMEDDTLGVVSQRIVALDSSNRPLLRSPEDAYENAFCTGPFLIRNGQRVFTYTTMMNAEMNTAEATFSRSDSSPEKVREFFRLSGDLSRRTLNYDPKGRYKVLPSQKNYKKYFSEHGEGNFLYGQRSGNALHINAAMCVDSRGRTFFVYCEGRGYQAPGIDRVQFTWLLSHMDVVTAVAIDGGFSANWIHVDGGTPTGLKMLLYSPDTARPLGSYVGLR